MSPSTTSLPDRLCPSCGVRLPETAVLCVECGYDIRTGMRLQRATPAGVDTAPAGANIEDSSANPYRSPAAQDEDLLEKDSLPKRLIGFISLRGRVSRWYWWNVHLAFAFMEFVFAVMEITETLLGPYENIVTILIFMFLWVIFSAHVRRWHDIERSGWWWLVNCIPAVGWLYSLAALGFERGTEGRNAYGEDPRRFRRTSYLS